MDDEIDNEFQNCVRKINNMRKENIIMYDDFIIIYGLYKQALFGDNIAVKPYWFFFHNMSKWNSWKKHAGKSKNDAKETYISIVKFIVF
jgi:diazepam-binding inhibitor (GABA receptor modulating acyl-CoA-binding protein)